MMTLEKQVTVLYSISAYPFRELMCMINHEEHKDYGQLFTQIRFILEFQVICSQSHKFGLGQLYERYRSKGRIAD